MFIYEYNYFVYFLIVIFVNFVNVLFFELLFYMFNVIK